jgi:hypothetical protein
MTDLNPDPGIRHADHRDRTVANDDETALRFAACNAHSPAG